MNKLGICLVFASLFVGSISCANATSPTPPSVKNLGNKPHRIINMKLGKAVMRPPLRSLRY